MSRKFRPGYNAGGTNQNRNYEDKVLLFAEGQRHRWLQNYLSDGKQTHFRILPSFTDGDEDVALNPEGNQDTSMFDLFGRFSACMEIATGIGTRRYTFASGCFEDDAGETVNDGWSVTKQILHRIKYKLYDMSTCKKFPAGAQYVDIPPSWTPWMNENFQRFRLSDPMTYVCFQVVASMINGEQVVDGTGKPTWDGPYLFAVRRSAMDSFLADLRTKKDPNEDLSLTNNLFGDFCSAANGSVLMLRKVKSEDSRDGSPKANYDIRPLKECPLAQTYVESMFVPWDELLHMPTIEEAVKLCAETFDGIAIDFALRDSSYDKYIPVDYRGSSANIADSMRRKDREAMLRQGGSASSGRTTTPLPPPQSPEDDIPMGDTVVPSTPAPPPAAAAPPPPPAPSGGTSVNLGDSTGEAKFDQALANIRGGE